MASPRTVLLLALGEGDAEEGESFRRPGTPGDPIAGDECGALHILVGRILSEKLALHPVIVWPPRIRGGRRSGNPGLLFDLAGVPRGAVLRTGGGMPGGSPWPRPRWLDACVGRNRVDLVVVTKDCRKPGCAEATRSGLRAAVGAGLAGIPIVVAAAMPSLEGWLVPIPESDGVDEREAKRRWHEAGYSLDPGRDYLRRAREVDLDVVVSACPDGFGVLVSDLAAWAEAQQVRGVD
ncbi:MAG: hypothetical protein HY907_02270 [Deltaproteobacteria bacterium]|nr:hypothetical protein [Deltaproteobacteria bacterium]